MLMLQVDDRQMDPREFLVEADIVMIVMYMYNGLEHMVDYVQCTTFRYEIYNTSSSCACYNCLSLVVFKLFCELNTGHTGLTIFTGILWAPCPWN